MTGVVKDLMKGGADLNLQNKVCQIHDAKCFNLQDHHEIICTSHSLQYWYVRMLVCIFLWNTICNKNQQLIM